MKNKKIDKIMMNYTINIANISSCQKKHVGAIIVKDLKILSSGYNGTPAGTENCKDHFPDPSIPSFKNDHREWSETHEIHAEQNAIAYAARNGINIEGAKMYVTYSPCINCAKMIVASGISEVIYLEEYKIKDGLNFLKECNKS